MALQPGTENTAEAVRCQTEGQQVLGKGSAYVRVHWTRDVDCSHLPNDHRKRNGAAPASPTGLLRAASPSRPASILTSPVDILART